MSNSMPSLFHHTFLNILFGKDELDVIYNNIKGFVDFNFNFNLLEKTVDTVEKIAPFLLQKIKKEQELIETNEDYYVARDLTDNIVYICFKNLLMIDIDAKENVYTDQYILDHFSKINDQSFSIYKNELGGFHVFCISKKYEYRNSDTINFMINNMCDFYYSIHCYIRGFCVRLNRKFENNSVYYHFKNINYELADSDLLRLLEIHNVLLKKYTLLDCTYTRLH